MFVGTMILGAVSAFLPPAIKAVRMSATMIEQFRLVGDLSVINKQALLYPEELQAIRTTDNADAIRFVLSGAFKRADEEHGSCECGRRGDDPCHINKNMQLCFTVAEGNEYESTQDANRLRELIGIGRERRLRWGKSTKAIGLQQCHKCGAAKRPGNPA
jgi:hypothetical protein